MPRLPTDYSRNVIYKLCCLDQSITDIYVGQTTDFTKRKNCHKSNCNNENSKEYNLYVYQFIRLHGGWKNWNMIQVEEYPCNHKREAEARETYWMKELKSTLNSHQSFLSEEERQDYMKEYDKERRQTDKRKQYDKQRRQTDKRKQYRKDYQKEYIKTDKYKEYKKEYYYRKSLYLNELKYYNI